MQHIPDFFLIGAAKAGTTFLAGLLDQHPEICISQPKEPKFFTTYWNQGWDWYEQCFAHAGTARVWGDASTQYSITGVYPQAVERLAKYAPQAKLIYVVREPFARLESQWVEDARAWTTAPVTFAAAVRDNPEYVDATCYWRQYSAYEQAYGAERILVLSFETLIREPLSTAKRCAEFLGVESSYPFSSDTAGRNSSDQKRRPRALARSVHRLAPRLVEGLARRTPDWLQPVLKKVAKSSVARPQWTPELREWVRSRVAEEFERIQEVFYELPPSSAAGPQTAPSEVS